MLPLAIDYSYDYLIGEIGPVIPGTLVRVPLGTQIRTGVVWDRPVGLQKPINPEKLKRLAGKVDIPGLPVSTMRFAEWISWYTLSPLGMVIRMTIGARATFGLEKPCYGVQYTTNASVPLRMTPARTRVMKISSDGQIRSKTELARISGCTTGVIDGLVQAGVLVNTLLPEKAHSQPNPTHEITTLNNDQKVAAHMLKAAVEAKRFSVSLLDGVTGAGKTEVYYEAVASALAQGLQVLIILPEIALTNQFMQRFKRRFGCAPVEWHSAIRETERGRVWRAVALGKAQCVVGARSGLFLPYKNLGLIVVDEEHDSGFKQDDRVNYHARDMAVVRASLGKFAIILASATPSIESHVNVRTGRYNHVILPGRYSGIDLPEVTAIDLKLNPPKRGHWLSPILITALKDTLNNGRQSLLFLNRRGYAPLTLCRACGHRFDCPQCSSWLVEHRFRTKLSCHYCGFTLPMPKKCPQCSKQNSLVACGPGIERILEEVIGIFPGVKTALLSSDLIPTINEMRKVITQIETGEIDIIIGTQIIAKGHHFPNLETVGIVDGDLGFAQADPRAGERSFQMMHQVTGRAGRVMQRGRGFIQTYLPDHSVIQAIITGDRDAFVKREINERRTGMLPPFGRLAALIISARDKSLGNAFAHSVARSAPKTNQVTVLGPVEAPLSMIRGRHRWRLLVKATREIDIQSYLRVWISQIPAMKGDVRLNVDIDPYNFM